MIRRILNLLKTPRAEWELAMMASTPQRKITAQQVLSCLINLERDNLVVQSGKTWMLAEDKPARVCSSVFTWSQDGKR